MKLDLFISQLFLLVWLGIFYGILYLFNRFIPKGFYIVQILFVLTWMLLRYYDFDYLGYLFYDDIPIFWIIASIMLVFSKVQRNFRTLKRDKEK